MSFLVNYSLPQLNDVNPTEKSALFIDGVIIQYSLFVIIHVVNLGHLFNAISITKILAKLIYSFVISCEI